MQNLIQRFNQFFEGEAKAEIQNDRLKITIGTQTMEIQVSFDIGIQSSPMD